MGNRHHYEWIMSTQPLPTQSRPPEAPSAQEHAVLPLAQQLVAQLTLAPNDWHRLKANRQARALEQAAIAIVFLLKDQPQEALVRLRQAVGWLDRSISAPPCPTHGPSKTNVQTQPQTTVTSGSDA